MKTIMASATQSRRRGWWCAPELLVALIIATTLLRGCSGGTPVPVVVSTVHRSVPNVVDVAADGAGTLLLLTYSGAVYCGFPNGTTVQLVATISSGAYRSGITCDVATNVAYVTSWQANRVYKLVLSTKNASIFAGSGEFGSVDRIGTDAQFKGPSGIVHNAPTGLLYVADWGAIRKIVVATANVTTVAAVDGYYLCITANGTNLYVATDKTIVRVSTALMITVTKLAGSTRGYKDGVGAAAQLDEPRGIALNSDESALIIADNDNRRIRRLELSNTNVTTIAGSGAFGVADGPGLSATFSNIYGATWHCHHSSLCGLLVADYSDAVRFVAIEGPTCTVTASRSSHTSATSTLSFNHTRSANGTTSTSQATASQTSSPRVTPSTSVELTDSQHTATDTAASSWTLTSSNSHSLTRSQATASQNVSHSVSTSLPAVSPSISAVLTPSQRSSTHTSSSSATPLYSNSSSLTQSKQLITASTTSTTDRSQSRTFSRTSTHNSRTTSASPTGTTSLSAVTWTRSPFTPSLVPTDTLTSPSADVSVTPSNTSTLGTCTDAIHVVLSPPLSMFLNDSIGTVLLRGVRSSVSTLDELCLILSTPTTSSPTLPCVYLEPTMDTTTTNTTLRWSAAAASLSSSPVRLVLAYNVGASWRVAAMSSSNATTTTTADDAGSVTITPADTVPRTPGSMGFASVLMPTSPTYGEQRTLWFQAGCAAVVVNISVVVTWPTRTVNKATEVATMAASSAAAALGGDVVSAASLVLLSMMSCSTLAPDPGVSMYVMSVFVNDGSVAMVMGNVGLGAGITLLHFIAVVLVAKCRSMTIAVASSGHLRFPAISLRVVDFLLPGTMFSAFLCFWSSASGAVAAGVVGVVVVAGTVTGTAFYTHRHVLPVCQQLRYDAVGLLGGVSHYFLYRAAHPVEARLLFPHAYWEPRVKRRLFAPLIMPYVCGREWTRTLTMLLALLLAAVAGAASSGVGCAAGAWMAGATHIAAAAALVVIRPFRLPSDSLLAPLSTLIVGVACVMKATGSAGVVAVGDQMTAAVAVVQVLRTLLCVLVEWRERQVDRDVPPSAKWMPPRMACEAPPLHLAFEQEEEEVFAATLIEDVDVDPILMLTETDKSAVIATNHEATSTEGVSLYEDIGGYFIHHHHQDQDDESQEVTLTTYVDNGLDWM